MKEKNIKRTINFALVFTLLGIIVIGSFSYSGIINKIQLNSSILAIIINIINFVVAIYLFKTSLGKGNNAFLIRNIGGMGIRFIILLIVIFISLKFSDILNIDIYGFILVFFIFYFVYLILEINFFRTSSSNNGK